MKNYVSHSLVKIFSFQDVIRMVASPRFNAGLLMVSVGVLMKMVMRSKVPGHLQQNRNARNVSFLSVVCYLLPGGGVLAYFFSWERRTEQVINSRIPAPGKGIILYSRLLYMLESIFFIIEPKMSF